jgi:membrane protein implicated in regulation of membrane protease activity
METLLAVITIIQRAGGKRLLLTLCSRLAVLLWLILTAAITVSAITVYALIYGHIALLDNGVSAPLAALSVGGVALLIIATLFAVIARQLRSMYRLPKKSPLMDTLDAFTDGLMTE